MKKNKTLKIFIVLALMLCTVAILFACSPNDLDYNDTNNNGGGNNGNEEPIVTTITITFMDGDEVIKESTKPVDALEYEPDAKEGFVFDGWYLDEDLTEAVAFKPTKDVTLYAKWSVATFTVRFLDGEGQPILVNGKPTQTVAYGESAIAPEAPEMEGYEFVGWNMEFDEVKSDLTIRALYDTERMSIILYGEDGSVIKTEKVMVGENISLYYNTMLEYASSVLPGGLNLVGLFTDSALENEYQIPSGEHVMPANDIHLYTKASLQDIDGLTLTPTRNNFRYDLSGLRIDSALYANSVVTYSYEWYDVTADSVIAGETSSSLNVPSKDVGQYTYEIKVTATYKNLTPVTATERVTINVELGTLEGLVSTSGYNAIYNGEIRPLQFNGTLASDKISYKLKGEALYSEVSPIKNVRTYEIESKIERENYEAIELPAVTVTINPKELTARTWMEIRVGGVLQPGDPYYEIEYGTSAPEVQYEISGFVAGEDESVFDNKPAQVSEYSAGKSVGNYYPTISMANCYANDSDTPRNYTFGAIYNVQGEEGALWLKVKTRALGLTLKNTSLTYGDVRPTTFDVEINNAFADDITQIQDAVNKLVACDYVKGSPVVDGGYQINIDGAQMKVELNNRYAVTVTPATLTVNKANVTITPKAMSVTYGDDIPSYDYDVTGLVNGENKSVLGSAVYACKYEKGSEVKSGGYPINFNASSFQAEGSNNYNITLKSSTLTVNPKAAELALADHEITYFDLAPENNVFVNLLSVNGIIETDTLESITTNGFNFVVENYNQGSSVGEYKVRVDFNSSVNYVVNGKKTVYGKLNVAKRALTISVVEGTVTYGNAIDVNVTYEGLVGEEYFDPSLAVSGGEVVGGYQVGDGIGEYTIEIGNYVSDNYEITTKSGKITVVSRKITLKARAYTDDEVIWSGSMSATDGSVAFGGEGLYENDVIGGVVKTTASTQGAYIASGANIGEKFAWDQALTIERDGASTLANYEITYDFQVAIATYGVFVNANEVVYDGLSHGLDVDHIFETPIASVLFAESAEGEYSETALTYSQAGSYDVYYAIRVYDANGDIEKEIKEKLTVVINPRPINFVAKDVTITYGESAPALEYEVNGTYAEGESLATLGEFNIEAVDFTTNAGRYDIVISGLANDNYDITITNAKFTINQAPLTVTATSFNITYGDAVPTFTATCEGFVNGEDLDSIGTQVLLSSTYTAVSNRKAGDFDIVPSLSLANYKVTAVNGTLAVAKMAITLTAENKSVFFGDDTPVLTAKANKLGYNDTVNDIGEIELLTSYVSGNNVGSYTIVLNAISEKYTITEVDGKVTVNPYKAVVTWSGTNTTYTYNGEDRSSAITATYKDVKGINQPATVSFVSNNTNGPSTTPNNFQNASDYTVSATTADTNYQLVNEDKTKLAVITLTMGKASYENITHRAFSGVYSPIEESANLNTAYTLDANFRWATGSAVPTVDVISYLAIYNADSENYYDYPIDISVELTPAIVTIQTDANTTGSIETGYDVVASINTALTSVTQTYTLTPVIYWNDGATTINSGFTLSYSNGTNFVGGTHLTTMTFSSVNYKIDSTATTTNGYNNITNVNWFIKYKSVAVGNTLYTPEDAIKETTSGTIIVKNNSTFAYQQAVVERYYNSTAYYTISSDATFLVPYKSDDTIGYLPGGTAGDGSNNFESQPNATAGDSLEKILYITLNIPSNVTLNVNGAFTIGAKTGKQDAGTQQNNITGNYSIVNLAGNIVANSASINVYGYVYGAGTITANNTTITENLYLSGWLGGTQSVSKYVGNQSLDAWQFLEGGEVTINNEYAFPFNQYELRAIQTNLVVNFGSTLQGWLKISTGAKSYAGLVNIDAMATEACIIFISSNPNNAESGLMRLMDSTAKITKSFANDRVRFAIDGNVADGANDLSAKVLKASVNMTSKNVFFPIDGRTDLVINSGATFTQSCKFKMLPGATLTVQEGATYNVNAGGQLIAYTKDFVDNATYPYPSATRKDAKVIVNGTMNINGAFGGNIYSTGAGKVVVGASATLTVVSNESTADGTTMDVAVNLVYNAKVNFTVGTTNTHTKQAVLNNASGSVLVATGKTYTYNGTAWA